MRSVGDNGFVADWRVTTRCVKYAILVIILTFIFIGFFLTIGRFITLAVVMYFSRRIKWQPA